MKGAPFTPEKPEEDSSNDERHNEQGANGTPMATGALVRHRVVFVVRHGFPHRAGAPTARSTSTPASYSCFSVSVYPFSTSM